MKGDSARLRQILNNLIGNAIKFTDSGAINVVTGLVKSEDDSDTFLKFWIEDTGVGIEDSAKGRIFEKFTQANASTTRRHGGTGLGLAICKDLVGLMGGEIGFESKFGEGSKFWFSVPLVLGDAKGAQTFRDNEFSPSLPREKMAPRRMLLVEDHPVN